MAPPSMNGGAVTTPNGTNAVPLEGASAEEGHIKQFWSRFEMTKHNDKVKSNLLEEVLTRYDYLIRKHQEYIDEHQHERELAQQSLQREQFWEGQAMHLQRILNRDPYILVLLDGDGVVFNDSFLKLGEVGGKQAATLLHNAVVEWAAAHIPECPKEVKIVARVYANLKGIANTCVGAGITSSPEVFEEFARGFTRGRTLFDFIDVGPGKDRADGKINETFKLYLYDYHCRQVLLGCSHDNGYARLLEQFIDETEVHPRFTMLEGVPFEKELQALPFRTAKFPGLFRETKIMTPNQMDLLTGRPMRADSRVTLNPSSGVFTPRTTTPISVSSPYNEYTNQGPGEPSPPASVQGGAVGGTGTSWAGVATKGAKKPFTDLHKPTPSTPPVETVKRNRSGQRLDTALEYNATEVARIKKLKSCNQHYIGIAGCCHYKAGRGDKCPHNHHYNFSAEDLKWLRVVARETPCKRGHDCDEPKCIYGHHCPFPAATEGSLRGSGLCLNGEACRFPASMHGMDLVAVKMTKVAEMF